MSQTIPDSYGSTIDLLNEVAEFLEGQADVRDGSYGEQVPNRAMSLMAEVELTIERLKRDSRLGPSRELPPGYVAIPLETLKKWKTALEPYWFSSDGEDEDNNDGVIETDNEIESYIVAASRRATGDIPK
jgi:hypothetical protein